MRKLPLIILGVALSGLIGLVAYIAFMDVPVTQQELVRPIPNDRFFGRG